MTRDDIVKQALHKLVGHDAERMRGFEASKDYDPETETWSVRIKCSCGKWSLPMCATDEYLAQHPLAFYELPLRW